MQNLGLENPTLAKISAKLKLSAPIIISVRNCNCLTEFCRKFTVSLQEIAAYCPDYFLTHNDTEPSINPRI